LEGPWLFQPRSLCHIPAGLDRHIITAQGLNIRGGLQFCPFLREHPGQRLAKLCVHPIAHLLELV
jgi:hypothetical protein